MSLGRNGAGWAGVGAKCDRSRGTQSVWGRIDGWGVGGGGIGRGGALQVEAEEVHSEARDTNRDDKTRPHVQIG